MALLNILHLKSTDCTVMLFDLRTFYNISFIFNRNRNLVFRPTRTKDSDFILKMWNFRSYWVQGNFRHFVETFIYLTPVFVFVVFNKCLKSSFRAVTFCVFCLHFCFDNNTQGPPVLSNWLWSNSQVGCCQCCCNTCKAEKHTRSPQLFSTSVCELKTTQMHACNTYLAFSYLFFYTSVLKSFDI